MTPFYFIRTRDKTIIATDVLPPVPVEPFDDDDEPMINPKVWEWPPKPDGLIAEWRKV